jgi:hypothetical protein
LSQRYSGTLPALPSTLLIITQAIDLKAFLLSHKKLAQALLNDFTLVRITAPALS